jgi:hypothetical protein
MTFQALALEGSKGFSMTFPTVLKNTPKQQHGRKVNAKASLIKTETPDVTKFKTETSGVTKFSNVQFRGE